VRIGPRSSIFKNKLLLELQTSIFNQMCPKHCRSSEKQFEY